MLWRLDLWDRFRSASFWWMHLMICLWLLFAFILFIAEPLILHRHFRQWATGQPAVAFAWLHWAHWVLLALSVVTILGAVAGSYAGFWVTAWIKRRTFLGSRLRFRRGILHRGRSSATDFVLAGAASFSPPP